jgi:hypothetical protein
MISWGETDRYPLGVSRPWVSMGRLAHIPKEPEQLIGAAEKFSKPALCKEGPEKER